MPIKKGLLLICGKTGRVVGLNRQCRWARWLFPFIGLAALIWFLVRVIPKPSRSAYPCQRVAAPIAFGGISYLLSLFGAVSAYRHAKKLIRKNRYVLGAVCLVIGLVCAVVVIRQNESSVQAAVENTGTFTPVDPPNTPIGTARGIYPGRVAWSYDTNACNWDGSSSYWWSTTYNNQVRITKLMNNVICSVAGQSSVSNAWDVLFRCKNGGPSSNSYVKGEKITIKINLNNGGKSNEIDASPQSVYALLDGLVNQFGASQADITICDPARTNQCYAVSNYCTAAFPNVTYDQNINGFTANAFTYSVSGPTENSLATVVVNTKYLITMALLKRHTRPYPTWGDGTFDDGNSPVTMLFKSDWGIIGPNRSSQHELLHTWVNSIASYDLLVDIYGSKNINGKTVLTILDGLYSGSLWNSSPTNWVIAPFNGHYPSSIFASQDPVALESVGLDFIWADMGLVANADRHLREAALANNPPSGTVYKPDGVRLQSLGVHEHWNNSTNKQFSRNLGTGLGIELVTIAPGVPSVSITGFTDGASSSQNTNLLIQSLVINNTNPISQVAFYQGTQLLGATTNSSNGITWSNVPAGNFVLTAVATDSLGLSVTSNPVTIIVVSTAPWAGITNPANGSSFVQGTNLLIQAALNNDTNPASQIAFYQGTQLLGSSISSPYGITWSNAPAGGYVLTAVATDSLGLIVTSSPVNITVFIPPTPLTWDADTTTPGAQDGGGVWNLASPNWWNGTTNVVWNNALLPASTILGMTNSPAGTITLGAAITVSNLTFNPAASGDYTIAGGGYSLTLTNAPAINVATNCSPTIAASVTGSGFSKTGVGMLTLSGANTCSGTLAIAGGTLALTGDNSGSTANGSVAPGTTLQLASANGFKGALALNSGSTLQLRADNNTTFAPASITLDNAADTNNFDAGPAGAATGRTLALSGALAFAANSSQTINVTGSNNYSLVLGAISATASSDHNPYRVVTINAVPGVTALVASFTAGNYGDFLNLNGGGNVTFTGNLGNTSNGSAILFVNGGTKATLQGLTAKSNTGDAFRYFVPNGVLVVDKNGALTNNTTGAGLNSSLFILGAATNFMASGSSAPAGFLIATNNSFNCAVYLGDVNYPNGGLILRANVTNYVSDGDVGFTNSGTFTIGGQNTIGVNTFANPIILGWTANRGKSVTLVAATGGTMNFTGNILANGTDTSAGVTVGDATHGGIVKLSGTNTYKGGTTISNGTLLVSGSIGSGAVTVGNGGTLGGGGTIGGAVTSQSGGSVAPGASVSTAGTVLTIANGLTLNSGSYTTMSVSHNSQTNDQIASAAIAYGGTLTVTTNVGDGPFVAGDVFRLVKANSSANYSGSFSATNLPALSPGLAWSNSLGIDGSIEVISVPPPVAGFTGMPTNLFVTQSVVFMDASTGSITNWGWNFGDGHAITNNSNVNVTNTYGAAGSFTVSLVVSGAGGSSTNTQSGYVMVKPKAAIGGVSMPGGSMVFSGTNGPAGAQYRILTSTNLSLPLTDWTPVATNVFAPDGSYSYTNMSELNSAGYFLLVSP